MTVAASTIGADEHALLALILDATHDCIKLLDPDGRIEFVNRRGAETMELRAPEELVGHAWLDRWPDEQPKIEEALNLARTGERARFEAMRPRPDGSTSWWDVTVAPVYAIDGTFAHFLTIARDTTREVIQRQRAEAINAEMRHRLRNAMTIAAGLVAMTARGKPELRTFAAEITQRFAELANVQAIILDPSARKDFAEIFSMLAAVYGDGKQLEFGSIPDVQLDDAALQALALGFGELCTNSLKYGALASGGKVKVEAEAGQDRCIFVWREETVFGRERQGGQGLVLIDRIVGAAGGRVKRTLDGSDLIVRISLPLADNRS